MDISHRNELAAHRRRTRPEGGIHQAAIGQQAAKGILRAAAAFMEPREIEMRIRQRWIEGECVPITLDGVAVAMRVLEQDGKIEEEQGTGMASRPIDSFRFLQLAADMQEAPEIDASLDMAGIERQAPQVSDPCGRRVLLLDRVSALEVKVCQIA